MPIPIHRSQNGFIFFFGCCRFYHALGRWEGVNSMSHAKGVIGCLVLLVGASAGLAQQVDKNPTKLTVLGVDVELGTKWADAVALFVEVSPPLNLYPNREKGSLIISRKDGSGSASLRFTDGRVSSISNTVYSAAEEETVGAVNAFEALFQLLSRIEGQDGPASASINLTANTGRPDLGARWAIDIKFLNGKNVEYSMLKVDNRLNKNVTGVFISEELSK